MSRSLCTTRFTAPSRTSARPMNFARRSFMEVVATVAVSRPLFSAFSSATKRASHFSDSITYLLRCCCCCSSSRLCIFVSIKCTSSCLLKPAMSSPVMATASSQLPTLLVVASVLGARPLAPPGVSWPVLESEGAPLTNCTDRSNAPFNASTLKSRVLRIACSLSKRLSLNSAMEPGIAGLRGAELCFALSRKASSVLSERTLPVQESALGRLSDAVVPCDMRDSWLTDLDAIEGDSLSAVSA
mmetsp:Transcript_119278/g.349071  ORF Transcript_119278/g.349071 Transcript_119278/m.349071 type:complete len:243 (+) Transcript_119278:491-1219(+)